MGEDGGIASEQDLRWLNDGFDEEAVKRIDAAHIADAMKASPTPPHWRFGRELETESPEEGAGPVGG